jgi:hypothetical protein
MRALPFNAALLLGAALLAGPAAGEPNDRPTVEVRFARQVRDRQPVDPGTEFPPGKLYCWTRLESRESHYLIAHHWMKNGRRVWRQPIQVQGKHWVTWSHFNVTPGSWTVRVTDESGVQLESASFTVK